MGREKRHQPGHTAKDRHKRAGKTSKTIDRSEPLPPGLVAAKPNYSMTKSKHQTYFEFIENTDKKKPLLFEITGSNQPPPGMKFIPIGNPELTERCKEISREEGALVYIVTTAKKDASELSQQIRRSGHHIREYIVDRAMAELGHDTYHEPETIGPDQIEKIPHTQAEINKQADAALRELFPRIPNTDRQQIVDHAFQKGKVFNGELVVGLQQALTLSRRVQLAVLAHIRHNHTRYDDLLRETSWTNARRATEQLCLDILVKWRGDDENGRNQLDEILREVVVLSDDDSEDEEYGEEPDSDSSAVLTDRSARAARLPVATSAPVALQNRANSNRLSTTVPSRPGSPKPAAVAPGNTKKKLTRKQRKKARRHPERNFGRYEAARNAAWEKARMRQRQETGVQPSHVTERVGGSASHGAHPRSSVIFMDGLSQPEPRSRGDRSFAAPPYQTHMPHFGSLKQKVIEPVSGGDPMAMDVDRARVEQNNQLRDLLHPSIEPRSPVSVRPSSHFTRSKVHYGDLVDEEPRYRPASPPRGPVFRDPGQMQPPRVSHTNPGLERPLYSRETPRAPARSSHNVPQDRTRPPSFLPPRSSDGYSPRDGPIGERTNPILVEDQSPRRKTVVLGPGETVRDRFGPNVEILSVRPHGRDVDRFPEPQRTAARDEGFIRLRESRPAGYRDSLQEEGFLRIREHPENMLPRQTLTTGRHAAEAPRPLADQYHYRPVSALQQAAYARRLEARPMDNLAYHGATIHPAERARADAFARRDSPPQLLRSTYTEPYPQHELRGAYEVPVHRHAKPTVKVDGPPQFRRYPSTPPEERHRPHFHDDVIVLD